LIDPPPGSGATYEPVIRSAEALPTAPADDGNVNESIVDALGAMLGTVGNGVTALADPRIALTTAGFAVTLPEFVTLNTATYWPLPFTDRDCSVEVICATGAMTVSVVLVEVPFNVAPTLVLPAAAAVAKPDELIVAVDGVPELHVALVVTFCVLPSLYVPVAVNCRVAPVTSVGFAGVIAIDCSVAAVPVRVAMFDVTLLSVAVMFVEPTPVTVARPPAAIVAAAVFEDVHVTCVVRFCVVLSL